MSRSRTQKNNMDEHQSKTIACRLIAAKSAEDVRVVLNDNDARFYFDDPQNWSPYGNREKNWDTVGNQQTNPIGALVEIVTNGIDTILLRKAREAGITDFRASEAPSSMVEAVKRFFPYVVEGKIQRLGSMPFSVELDITGSGGLARRLVAKRAAMDWRADA